MQGNRRYPIASDRAAGACSAPGRVSVRVVSPSSWFQSSHPLAQVAQLRCSGAGHRVAGRHGVVSCGACWERAVRDDERFASECGLPGEVTADATGVDEIAVERACTGDTTVTLTRFEVWAAVARLHRQGLTVHQIAARLDRNSDIIRRILAGLAATANAVVVEADAADEAAEQAAGAVEA